MVNKGLLEMEGYWFYEGLEKMEFSAWGSKNEGTKKGFISAEGH